MNAQEKAHAGRDICFDAHTMTVKNIDLPEISSLGPPSLAQLPSDSILKLFFKFDKISYGILFHSFVERKFVFSLEGCSSAARLSRRGVERR